MTATRVRGTTAVLEVVTYLDDVAEELRRNGVPVESTTVDTGPPITAQLAIGSGVTLAWHRTHGWSLTDARTFPLRLSPTTHPDKVATLAVLLGRADRVAARQAGSS